VIPEREQRIIQERFAAELAGRVRIDYFTQRKLAIVVPGRAECRYCEEVGQALHEIATLHPRIALSVHEFAEAQAEAERLGVKRVPCTVIRGQANRALRYYGLPGGHQFANFIETIIMSSRSDVTIGRDASVALKKLREPARVSVFVTPTCEYSAVVANTAFRMALAQASVKAEVVEISEFPELVQRFAVTATPTTVIDGRTAIRGVIDETQLARQILRSAESEAVPAVIDAGPATPFESEPAAQPAPIVDPAAPRIYIPGR
jgi:glutaredoxin-like protein